MNTTYSQSKEEVLDRVKSRLEHFEIKAEESVREDETAWTCKVLFRTELVGFINCIHRIGLQDQWTVLRHLNGVISSFSTTDFDAAIDFLMS